MSAKFKERWSFYQPQAGHYLSWVSSAAIGGADAISVCGDEVGPWETFLVYEYDPNNNQIILQGNQGKYMGYIASQIGDLQILAPISDSDSSAAILTVKYLDGKNIALWSDQFSSYLTIIWVPFLDTTSDPSFWLLSCGDLEGAAININEWTTFQYSNTIPWIETITKSKSAIGMDLSDTNLIFLDLTGVDLTNTVLNSAVLKETNLTQATLIGTDFSNTDLTQTIFSPQPAFSTDPNNLTKFIGATLNYYRTLNLNWSYLNLTGATIIDLPVDLSGLQAQYTVVPNIDLSNYTLQNAQFDNATLTGAQFNNAILTDAFFAGAKLLQTKFMGAVLTHANLTGAQLGGEDHTPAADLSYAYLEGVILDQANLFGVNLPWVTLFDASLQSTVSMEQVNFAYAYLENITLTNATLKGAKFDGACLISCQFNGADLTASAAGSIIASLTRTCLQGAQFTDAKLAGADLTNAAVAFEPSSIFIQHCDSQGKQTDPWPMNYPQTTGLDATTLQPDTVCPNGYTLAHNKRAGLTIQEMLIINDPPTQWTPVACRPSE